MRDASLYGQMDGQEDASLIWKGQGHSALFIYKELFVFIRINHRTLGRLLCGELWARCSLGDTHIWLRVCS